MCSGWQVGSLSNGGNWVTCLLSLSRLAQVSSLGVSHRVSKAAREASPKAQAFFKLLLASFANVLLVDNRFLPISLTEQLVIATPERGKALITTDQVMPQ